MSENDGVQVSRVRQWVTLRGSSMDARVGKGLLSSVAHDLRSAVGRPHGCALVHEAGVPADALEDLRRDLLTEGFSVTPCEAPEGPCDLGTVARMDALLADAGITSDDFVVAVGGEGVLAVVSFACASWCGGVSLAVVPTDLTAAIRGGVTPRPLDLPDLPRMVFQDGSARFEIVDVELTGFDPSAEDALLAFALMVSSAMGDSDKAFGRLWDAADDLAAGDEAALVTQLGDTLRSRGRIVSSTALAVRQSISYGQDFATALASVVGAGVPASALLADGMRFASRLAVAQDLLSVDDMFAQDEVLERLGVGTTCVPVDPVRLADALRAERFRRTRRFMMALPRSLGRVRLSAIDDELLAEHAAAWCAARPDAGQVARS